MRKSPITKYVCLIFAFISQLFLQQTFFTYSGSDRNKQLLAAKHFIDGHGLSLSHADPQNLSRLIFTPLDDWPPGYSLLAIPIYYLTGDWMLCARILAVIGLGLVFFATHLLFEQHFSNSHRTYLAFFAFWAISFTPFYYTSASGELALGFFLLGLWGTGRVFTPPLSKVEALLGGQLPPIPLLSKKVHSVIRILLPLLFFGLSASMRYAYLPMLCILPILLLFRYFQKTPIHKTYIFTSIAFALLITYLLLGFKTPSTASGRAVFQLPENLYFENWLLWDAFPIKAFAYMSVEGLLNKIAIPSIGIIIIKFLLGGFSLFIIGLGVYLVYPLSKEFLQKKHLTFGKKHWVAMSFFVAGLIVLAMLGGLSLLSPTEIHDNTYIWTYVVETRYYAFLLIGIQAFMWWFIFEGKRKVNKLIYYLCILFVFSCSLYSSLHTSIRYYQRFVQANVRETIYDTPSQRMRDIQDVIRQQTAQGKKCLFIYGDLIQQKDEASIAALEGAYIIHFEELSSSIEFLEGMVVITNVDE